MPKINLRKKRIPLLAEANSILHQRMDNRKLNVKNITFEITNLCNLKCKFCSIWQEKEKRYLPVKKIAEVLTSRIFLHPLESITLTGGEPFLHPEFDNLFKNLAALRFKQYIRKIGISSNGYDTERIKSFLEKNDAYLKDLELFISLDGFGVIHNEVRGENDAFEKTMSTIKTMLRDFEDVRLTLKFTISKYNVDEICKVYEFCKNKNINLLFKLQFFDMPHGFASCYRRGISKPKESKKYVFFDRITKEKIIKNMKKILSSEKSFNVPIVNLSYLSTLINSLQGTLKINSCFTPKYYLFVDSSGNAYSCLYQKPVANISKEGWWQEFYKEGYAELIEKAIKGICPGCIAYHGYLKYWNFKNVTSQTR